MALVDQSRDVLEESAAGDVAYTPEHRHEFDVRLGEVDVGWGWRDAVVVVPGEAIVRFDEEGFVLGVVG